MCERGVWVWLRGGEERGRAGRGISGRRLVEVRDRVGGKGSRRRGSVIKGVWGQSSPSCLERAGLSRGAGQRDAATFTLPYVFGSPPSGCSILSSLSLPRRGRDEKMEQPDGGGTNTYGRLKVAASRFPAPRDSPALSRQESDD